MKPAFVVGMEKFHGIGNRRPPGGVKGAGDPMLLKLTPRERNTLLLLTLLLCLGSLGMAVL